MSETALKHIEHLSVTIGARGSATPKEREAHDYVQQVLSSLGNDVRVETYPASPSAYLPFALALGLMLVAEAIFWLTGRTANAQLGALAASALALLVTVSTLLELWLADNPLRWFLPTAPSRNVIGVAAPAGQSRRTVVILAHVDSHRTPFIWYSRNTYTLYRALSTLGVVSLLAAVGMFVAGVFSPSAGLRAISLIPAVFISLALLMTVQGHFTSFSAGANDNASGVGVMLALAGRLARAPLKNTEVWWVGTGCEEVGAYGSADLVRRYAASLRSGAVVVVDNIAGKDTGPVYLRSEAFLLPMKYPAEMLALAKEVAAEHPELQARPEDHVPGVYTDGIHALKANLRCLAFVGLNRRRWIPNWHQKSDVFANVDADAVERTERFVWEVLQRFDQGNP